MTEAAIVHGKFSKKDAEERAVTLFRKLGLPDPENIGSRFPHQVSGGQLQRCMTAMAMSCRPRVLIADDDTLVRAGLRMMIETQDDLEVVAEARRYGADVEGEIEGGRIVAEGTHDSLVAEGGLYARLARLQFTEGLAAE